LRDYFILFLAALRTKTASFSNRSLTYISPAPTRRSVGDFIFDFLERSQQRGAQTGFDVTGAVSVACLEIYNEQIRDILAPFMDGGGLGSSSGAAGGAARGSFVAPGKGVNTTTPRASTVGKSII
jgi:hypothetical protein